MTVTANTGDDQTKSIEDLQAEVNDWKSKFEASDTTVKKLRTDLTEAKANNGAAKSLQDQIDKLTTDKSRLMQEKNDIQTGFDAYKKDVQVTAAKTHLTTALEEAGARNTTTAMKLIDMSAVTYDENGQVELTSIAEAVNAIKTSDPVLFKDQSEVPNGLTTPSSASTTVGQLPTVKHAADRLTNGGFDTEMAKAKSQTEIDAVFAKYYPKAN